MSLLAKTRNHQPTFKHLLLTRRTPIGWARKNATTLNLTQTAVCSIFGRFFSNFDKCRPELAGDVISGVDIEWIGDDVCVKCGDSMVNSDRII